MAIENFQYARQSLVSVIVPTRPEKNIFKIRALRKLENAILILGFASTVLRKRAILPFLKADLQNVC